MKVKILIIANDKREDIIKFIQSVRESCMINSVDNEEGTIIKVDNITVPHEYGKEFQ